MSNNSIKVDNYSSLDTDITFLNQKINTYNNLIPNSNLYVNRNECITNEDMFNNVKVLYSKNRKENDNDNDNDNYNETNGNNYDKKSKLTKDYYKNYFSSNYGQNLNEFIEEEKIKTSDEIYTNIRKSYINIDSNNRNKILYPENNDYVIDLNKSYTNVKKVSMISSEIPNTAYTIENNSKDITNNKIVWQNFDEKAVKIYDYIFKDISYNFELPRGQFDIVFCDAPNELMKYYLSYKTFNQRTPGISTYNFYDRFKFYMGTPPTNRYVLKKKEININNVNFINYVNVSDTIEYILYYYNNQYYKPFLIDEVKIGEASTLDELITIMQNYYTNVFQGQSYIIYDGYKIYSNIFEDIISEFSSYRNIMNNKKIINSKEVLDILPIKINLQYEESNYSDSIRIPPVGSQTDYTYLNAGRALSEFTTDETLKKLFNSKYVKISNSRIKYQDITTDYPYNNTFNINTNIFNENIGIKMNNYLDGIYFVGQYFLICYFYTDRLQVDINNYDELIKQGHFMIGARLYSINDYNYNIGVDKIPLSSKNLYPTTSRKIKDDIYGYIEPVENYDPIFYNKLDDNSFINSECTLDSGDYNDESMMKQLSKKMNDTIDLNNYFNNYNVSIDSKINKSILSMKKIINLSVNDIAYRPYLKELDVYSNNILYRRHFVIFIRIIDHNFMENELFEINDITDVNLKNSNDNNSKSYNSNLNNINTEIKDLTFNKFFNIIKNKPLRAHLCKFYTLSTYNIDSTTFSTEKKKCYRDYKNNIIDIYKWSNLNTGTTISNNFIYIDIEEILDDNKEVMNLFTDIESLNMGYYLYDPLFNTDENYYDLRYNYNTITYTNRFVPFPSNYLYDRVISYIDPTLQVVIVEPYIPPYNSETNYTINVLKKTKLIENDESFYNVIGFNKNTKGSDLIKKVIIKNVFNFYTDNVGLPRKLNCINLNCDNHQLLNYDKIILKDIKNIYSDIFETPKKINYINDITTQYVDFNNIYGLYIFKNYKVENYGYIYLDNTYKDSVDGNLTPIYFYDTNDVISYTEVFQDFIIHDEYLEITNPFIKYNILNTKDENDIVLFKLKINRERNYYELLKDTTGINYRIVQVSIDSFDPNNIVKKYELETNPNYFPIPSYNVDINSFKMVEPLIENVLYFGYFLPNPNPNPIDPNIPLPPTNYLRLYDTYEDIIFYKEQRFIKFPKQDNFIGRFYYNLNDILRIDFPNHCLYDFVNNINIVNNDIINTRISYTMYRKNKDTYFIQLKSLLEEYQKDDILKNINLIEIISNYNGHYIYLTNYNKEDIPNLKINYHQNRYILVKSNILSNTKPDFINNYNLDENNPLREDIDKVDNLFTKISLNSQNSIIFDSYLCNEKTYNDTPINVLNKIDFSFYREDGKKFSFNGLEHSFTLEVVEYIDELKNVNYSTIRGMKDTIGYNKETLYNEM